jgi:formylglycine-generating enzyme required for sulfatase activity
VVRRHIAAVSLGALVIACNALTGASDLGVCEGAACVSEGPDAAALPDANVDASVGGDGSMPLPASCTDGQKACEGRTAATCVGSAWNRTPCPEVCLDGACVVSPSCRNPSGTGCATSRSCCERMPVPAGTFNRRNAAATPATVSAFSLESFEVTVGRFRSFVTAGGGTRLSPPAAGAGAHPKIAGSGWQTTWNSFLPVDSTALQASLGGGTWTASSGANEHKPINNVSWMVAFAFCAADGGRLPTNAEWNYAAAGGSEQRIYPWSSPPASTTIAPANAAYLCSFALPAQSCPPSVCSVGGTSPCIFTQCSIAGGTCSAPACTGCDMAADVAPVGSLPAGVGRFGHFDLGGNVAELVVDGVSRKNNDPLPTPCVDCASLVPASPQTGGAGETDVLTLGGDWNGAAATLRTDDFTTVRLNDQSVRVGFRCAHDD